MAETKRPSAVMKLGGIEVAKWERKDDEGKTFCSFTFQRSYKNKDDKWENTAFFRSTDLPVLASMLLTIAAKNAKVSRPAEKAAAAKTEDEEDVPF